MITDSVQYRFRTRNPFEHDAILVVDREAKEPAIFPMQFVHLEFFMIDSVSEQFDLLKCDLLQLWSEFLQPAEEFRREADGNHTVRISLSIYADRRT